jgi:hypothetical protein
MDRATNMTGRLSRDVTRIQNVVKPNFMWVWYLLHQMDIIMQKVYKRAGCNFYKTLTSIIRSWGARRTSLRKCKPFVRTFQPLGGLLCRALLDFWLRSDRKL